MMRLFKYLFKKVSGMPFLDIMKGDGSYMITESDWATKWLEICSKELYTKDKTVYGIT